MRIMAKPCNMFVYGSLQSPKVLSILLGRVPTLARAKLKDHHRYSIKERVYPGVFPKVGGLVEGKLLLGITDREKRILDDFEGDEYECMPMKAQLVQIEHICDEDNSHKEYENSKELVPGFIYMFKDPSILYGSWDYEKFEKEDLEEFVKMCHGFAQGLHARIPF